MFTKNLIAELQFSNLVCRSTMEDYNGEFFFQIYNITTRPRTKIVDAKKDAAADAIQITLTDDMIGTPNNSKDK